MCSKAQKILKSLLVLYWCSIPAWRCQLHINVSSVWGERKGFPGNANSSLWSRWEGTITVKMIFFGQTKKKNWRTEAPLQTYLQSPDTGPLSSAWICSAGSSADHLRNPHCEEETRSEPRLKDDNASVQLCTRVIYLWRLDDSTAQPWVCAAGTDCGASGGAIPAGSCWSAAATRCCLLHTCSLDRCRRAGHPGGSLQGSIMFVWGNERGRERVRKRIRERHRLARYPCPPQASLHSWIPLWAVQEPSGLLEQLMAWISLPSSSWNTHIHTELQKSDRNGAFIHTRSSWPVGHSCPSSSVPSGTPRSSGRRTLWSARGRRLRPGKGSDAIAATTTLWDERLCRLLSNTGSLLHHSDLSLVLQHRYLLCVFGSKLSPGGWEADSHSQR